MTTPMTIDEAIKFSEEVAEEKESICNVIENKGETWTDSGKNYYDICKKCASEHRQLADWLKVLKEIWDSGDCNDCRNGRCEWKPKLGQLVRYNCPHYVGIANAEVNDEDSN